MPSAATGTVFDSDRLARRVVRIAMGITLVVAAILYAGKAAEDRSAFVRWRPQVLQLMGGVNIYNTTWFPNPPIMPISMYPLMLLPPVVGAMGWFLIKAALAIIAGVLCIRMVRPGAGRVSPWIDGAIVLLSMRPILSDLHHGNNNILILFLIVATIEAWRRGYDVLAGLILGFAITYKVTPALFVPYFLYKRSWRTVGATFLGMAIFFGLIPSLVLGPRFNLECLQAWWNRVIGPYIEGGEVGRLEINQSMVGVLMRLLPRPRRAIGTTRCSA